MKGARLGGLLARGVIVGATTVIVVVVALLSWPGSMVGPSADERRVQDLQRLTHAVEAFRARQHILPASLARLPIEPRAPVHTYDPVTNRAYDYRPLGPLAYELCARFDAAGPEERHDFWWHDAGRYCFSLETRPEPQPAAPAPPPKPATDPPPTDDGLPPAATPDAPVPVTPEAPPVASPPAPAPEGAGTPVPPQP